MSVLINVMILPSHEGVVEDNGVTKCVFKLSLNTSRERGNHISPEWDAQLQCLSHENMGMKMALNFIIFLLHLTRLDQNSARTKIMIFF